MIWINSGRDALFWSVVWESNAVMQLNPRQTKEHNMTPILTNLFVGAFTGLALLTLPAISAPIAPPQRHPRTGG